VFAFAFGLDSLLFKSLNVHFLNIDINAGDLIEEDRACEKCADQNSLR
jgi:hypothetical protein